MSDLTTPKGLAVVLREDGLGFTPNNIKYLKVLSGVLDDVRVMTTEEKYFYDVVDQDREEAAKSISRLRGLQANALDRLSTVELSHGRDGALWWMAQGLISMAQGVIARCEEVFTRSVLAIYGL